MDVRDLPVPARAAELAEESVATVARWLATAQHTKVPDAERRLSALLADPDGPEFAASFIDGVLRPADPKVAARNLDRLSRVVPESVRWRADIGTQLAGGFAPMLPAAIVPAVRENFLKTIGGLFLRLGTRDPHSQLAELNAEGGIRPMLAPIGSTASGHREAHRQLVDARDLLARDETSAISISLAQLVGAPRPLDLDGDVDYAVAQLEPLYELAAASRTRKFINLEVERLNELELTVRVFQQLSERHPQLSLGLTLPACLPDSLGVLERVTRWATSRATSGASSGAGEKAAPTVIRIVRGDHIADEHAEASARGWQSAAFAESIDTQAQVLRMLDAALTPERCAAVHIVIATHTPFDTAFAWRLARQRGVEGSVDHEFLLGIDSGVAHAVMRDVGGIQRYVPTLLHRRLAPIVPYLLRRVEDLTAGRGNDREVFLQALGRAMDAPPATLRRQDQDHEDDTDLSIAANRDRAHAILQRARTSAAGEELVVRARQFNAASVDGSGADDIVSAALAAGTAWGERRGSTRAEVLASVAETLTQWRGQLIEVAVSESQLIFDEADREVTVAVDSARQAAVNARALDRHAAVKYVSPRLIVVVGARTSPFANTVAELSAALAAGGAVILKAAPETERSSAVVIQALLAAGVPDELVTLVCGEDALAKGVISHPSVDRVVVTGHRHTAKLFHSWGAEISLHATIGGRNSVIVTPSADLDAAVADIVAGALDHAGQASTATNQVILVGSVAHSERFRGRLSDALSSIVAGSPSSPGTQLSSLASPASGSVLGALQDVGEGETWLVRPQQVDSDQLESGGRVWMPGLRDDVEAGSTFHIAQNRAPVLGIMTADTLTDAIELHNALGFGLAASIHSTDANELTEWLDTAKAGMLFINRATTQSARSVFPYGGWGRSQIGLGRMSGGRNELGALGTWEPVATEPGNSVTLHGVSGPVAELVEAAQPSMSFVEFDQVRSAVKNDETQWLQEFGVTQQLQTSPALATGVRYRPVPVTVRLAEGAPVSQLVRVLAAAARANAPVSVSTATPLPDALIALFASPVSPVAVSGVLVESAVRWHARVQSGALVTERIRLIGGDQRVLARVLHGRPGIAVDAGQVTADGSNELLTFLREQSISADLRRARNWDPFDET